MKLIKNTWLPIFKGFYETDYINDEYLLENNINDYDINDRLTNWLENNFYDHIDYNQFQNDFLKNYCNYLSNDNITFEYENIISPKEYNFVNDSCNVTVTINNYEQLKKVIIDNMELFELVIKEKYTSCSGFISSYSNNIDYWVDIINYPNFIDNAKYTHEIGTIIEFYLVILNRDYIINSIENYYNEIEKIDFSIYESIACNGCTIEQYIDYDKLVNAYNREHNTSYKSFESLCNDNLKNMIILLENNKYKLIYYDNNYIIKVLNSGINYATHSDKNKAYELYYNINQPIVNSNFTYKINESGNLNNN